MKVKSRFILLIAIVGTLFWRCAETKEVSPDELGTAYFPLKTGMYSIFEVSGTRYISSEDSAVFSYLLKESVLDSFQNLELGISYKIQRQKKYNENDTWAIDSIWTARKDDRTAVLVENNIPMVNLVFPFEENKTWDGNKLNDKGEYEFEMRNIRQPFSASFGSFDHTVTVVQEYLPDIYVKSISKKEIYAEGKGLVYKENIILNYKQGDDYGKEIIESGLKYFQHLVEYGEE